MGDAGRSARQEGATRGATLAEEEGEGEAAGLDLPCCWRGRPGQILAPPWLQFSHLAGKEVGLGGAQASFSLSAPGTLQVSLRYQITPRVPARPVLFQPSHHGHSTEPRALVT